MKIAYLVNRYPAVSHTFIRREIAALEASGRCVLRYSIRASTGPFPDARDAAEVARTTVILSGAVKLVFGLAAMLALHPVRTWRAVRIAIAMGRSAGGQAWRQLAYLAEAAWLVREWQRAGVSHVHAHFGTNPAAVARLARAMGGPPYSFTAHGPDEFDAPGAIDLAGKIADAAFVVAISDFGRSQLMRWARWRDWPRIIIIRCGLDADFIAAPVEPAPDAPHFCYVGRLSGQKGLPVLVDAAAMIAHAHPDLRITVVGDGPLKAELHERAVALGIADILVFVGAATNADVRRHLSAARALIVPSFAEGLPVVIMEALAMARPVIATAIAGIPELVDDSDGWIVRPGNARDLADAMAQAIAAPPAMLAAMGVAGRRRVAAQHDAARNASTLAALIDGGLQQ